MARKSKKQVEAEKEAEKMAAEKRKEAMAAKRASEKKASDARQRRLELKEAAERAAEEAIEEFDDQEEQTEEEPDQIDMNFADDSFETDTPEQIMEKDVFIDAFKKAQAKQDIPIFYIYKNSQWTARKSHPYSWERLQQEYGPGHYRVVAKSMVNGQNLVVQAMLVGGDEAPLKDVTTEADVKATHQPTLADPFAFFTLMNQQQEKAENKAAVNANAQANTTAMMMQTMMQLQQASSTQFQTMILEINKQSQAQAQQQQALLMTLLTNQGTKKESGMDAFEVMKLMQTTAKDAETRTKDWFRLVEDKAEKLADAKAELIAGQGEGEESITKTLLKGFVPILTQMVAAGQQQQAQGQQGQLTLEQQQHIMIERAQVEAQRRMPQNIVDDRPKFKTEAPRPVAPVIPSGTQPIIPGTINLTLNPQNPQGAGGSNLAVGTPFVPPKAPVVESVNTNGQLKTVSEKPIETPKSSRGINMKDEFRLNIFNQVKGDIGQALILRKDASKTAEACLKKLEKSGQERQAVAEAFTLEDFYKLAAENGLPEVAKPWITEFHEYIQKSVKAQTISGRGARTSTRESAQNI